MSKDVCINGCDLTGDPIPQEYIDKGYYGEGITHYSRMIGIDGGRLGIYDGVIAWTCPDCGAIWNRFSDPNDRRYRMTEEFIKEWNNEKE
jgi:hypothetical protein